MGRGVEVVESEKNLVEPFLVLTKMFKPVAAFELPQFKRRLEARHGAHKGMLGKIPGCFGGIPVLSGQFDVFVDECVYFLTVF